MFWKVNLLFLLNVVFLSKITYGYIFTNNPLECKDMIPRGLQVEPQPGPGPYQFRISHSMYDFQGELHVHILSNRSSVIRGIFLQARLAGCGNDDPLGTFAIFPGEHHLDLVNCTGAIHNAVVNADFLPYDRIRVRWLAPMKNVGPIYFRATIMEDKGKFWTENYSENIRPIGTQDDGYKCPQKITQGNGIRGLTSDVFLTSISSLFILILIHIGILSS